MATVKAVKVLILILSRQQILTFCDGANILFFLGFGSPSHRFAMEPLAGALIDKGHNVTFLVQDASKNTNPKANYFSSSILKQHFGDIKKARGGLNIYDIRASGMIPYQSVFVQKFGIKVCQLLYSDPEFLKWNSENKFDLVVIDALFNECGYGIAHSHKAKTIIFSVSTVLPWFVDGIGIPDETSFIPDVMFGWGPEMGFVKRFGSAVMPILWKLFRQFYYLPKLTSITKEGLGLAEFPDFAELEKKTDLVFLNTHASQEYPRSLPPNVISIGGISQIEKESKALPKNLEDWIEKGKEGFIYISFGSFIDFLTFAPEVQRKFINALGRFPNIQFIWKLNKTPDNLPKNVLIEKWLPQQDLLLHPKLRAFITHSGIGGVNEAIYSSVPLILFPILAEQDYNAHLIEKKGAGIKMEITDLTEDKLEEAINKLLTDKTYKTNMEKIAKQFLDRPMKPLETALWWTEYVLRQDTEFLRPHNLQQPWWVKRQLDVWLFLCIFTLAGSYISFKITKFLLRKCFKRGATKRQDKKQKLN